MKPTQVLKKQEISQMSHMNVSSWINHQVTLYSYIETYMHLIYKTALKRCIYMCTFHDNLLFLICSVDGHNQILEYLLIYMFYFLFCLYVYFRLRSYA